MTTCTYILGPCVDGTQAGRRCTNQAVHGDRCARHHFPVSGGSWSTTLDAIEATLVSMDREDRNDAIEALRTRFTEMYDR